MKLTWVIKWDNNEKPTSKSTFDQLKKEQNEKALELPSSQSLEFHLNYVLFHVLSRYLVVEYLQVGEVKTTKQ